MDPTQLHFSKRGLLVQCAVFLLFAVASGWVVWQMDLFAPQPPLTPATATYDPTPDILFDEIPRVRRRTGIDSVLYDWLPSAILIAAMFFMIWATGLRLWRLAVAEPMLDYRNNALVPHASLQRSSAPIAIEMVTDISVDRSDRLSDHGDRALLRGFSLAGYLGARLGQRLRHMLRIRYIDAAGHHRQIRIADIEVDGGTEQLRRFAAYVQAMHTARTPNATHRQPLTRS